MDDAASPFQRGIEAITRLATVLPGDLRPGQENAYRGGIAYGIVGNLALFHQVLLELPTQSLSSETIGLLNAITEEARLRAKYKSEQ